MSASELVTLVIAPRYSCSYQRLLFYLVSLYSQVGDNCQTRCYSSFDLLRAIRKGRVFNSFNFSGRYTKRRMLPLLAQSKVIFIKTSAKNDPPLW